MAEGEQKTVLIVDNDRTVCDTLAQIVEQMGHHTVRSERATKAANILMTQPVDVMLLDLRMPGLRGQDLLSYLRKKNLPVPPTIVVSGYLHKDVIGPLIKLGICGIIAKPFDQQRLRDELGRVLEGRTEGGFFFCAQCGAPAKADDRFCRQCGSGLERRRVCAKCGTACAPGDRFCGNCGDSLATG
ncbi:MAG: response regulator [Candidatus Latescibacterota bacterium]|jgi:CheY-like chemotaxis protein